MKYFSSLLAATLLVGVLIFAVLFWGLKWPYTDAMNTGFAGAIGGLAAEGVRYMRAKKKAQ